MAKVARPTAKGRVYCMSTKVGAQSKNLIHVNCEILGNNLTTLFDYGVTHSYIFMDYVNGLKILVSLLPFDLVVSTLAKTLTIDIACLLCQVTVQNRNHVLVSW